MKRRKFIAVSGLLASALALPKRLFSSAPGDAGLDAKARDLAAEMTFEEKIAMMAGKLSFLAPSIPGPYQAVETPGCPRLGIPGIRFVDGSRGIRFEGSTCFPAAMARGASWDPALEQRVGEAIGYEGRAQGANFFAGVCVNVLRHPRWGRSQETFGEDPHHLGRMGVAVVTGVQHHMMACAKHLAGNSIDRSRHYVDVRMNERTLREIYLPHFQDCVNAGVASIMSAYNSLNGEQCGHSKHLLKEILKGEWGFLGLVISDFGLGIKKTVPAANAGCDVEMDRRRHYGFKLKLAVKNGRVPMENIDDAVRRNVREQLRFLPLESRKDYDLAKVGGKEHAALAREVEQKSLVLLKNENQALPLERGKIKTIALIGELADTLNLGDTGSTWVTPPYAITPLQGITRAAGSEIKIIHQTGQDLESARQAAAQADAVVVVTGITRKDEGEGFDRKGLGLAPREEELILAMAEANARCVVVLEGGGAITMERWRDRAAAIIMAWYPGMEGGNAIADALFGDINPSGKLPIVFPKSEDQLYPFDNVSKLVEYGYYHGYRYFDRQGLEPAFPFGFGLSYTQYKYGNLKLSAKKISKAGTILASVDITNIGGRPGEEIAQLYVGCQGSRVDRPVKDLKAFAKVYLKPGETKTAQLEVPVEKLGYYDDGSGKWMVEEMEYLVYVGPSSKKESLLTDSFKVV